MTGGAAMLGFMLDKCAYPTDLCIILIVGIVIFAPMAICFGYGLISRIIKKYRGESVPKMDKDDLIFNVAVLLVTGITSLVLSYILISHEMIYSVAEEQASHYEYELDHKVIEYCDLSATTEEDCNKLKAEYTKKRDWWAELRDYELKKSME